MDFEKIISKERIHKNEPMKKYTSFKIGGNAETRIKKNNKIYKTE